MFIQKSNHLRFYEHQIIAQENKWREYASAPMNILIQEKRMYVGVIWGIQEANGYVILRFNEGEVPRLKQPYFVGLTTSFLPSDVMEWDFSYEIFRKSTSPRYYNGVNSEITPIAYWKTENGKTYILASGFDVSIIANIRDKYLVHSKHPKIIVAETDPPVRYLENLRQFIQTHENNNLLKLNIDVSETDWNPKLVDNEKPFINDVINHIELNSYTLIQGPPGTGKSYMAAQICDIFLKQSKSVCVTALTNKALIEVASQPPLEFAIGNRKVYKSNLTNDEKKDIPKLNKLETFTPKPGELLLTTYYKLSEKYYEIIEDSPRFDLMIIEEASQAYLATIAMFSSIAKKILIIGDHKQLTPVVLNLEDIKEEIPKIEAAINGLKTFAFNQDNVSFRLTKTRRLTSDAAKLTGFFYNHSLKSISDIDGKVNFVTKYKNLFHNNGGMSIALLSVARIGFSEKKVLSFITQITNDIISNNSGLEVAILTPYVSLEKELYLQYSKNTSQSTRVTINTIHKIQGLTCDITILYLPLQNPYFELNENIFNVATSRAKRGTLIITYNSIDIVSSSDSEVRQFINKCIDITDVFMQGINNL